MANQTTKTQSEPPATKAASDAQLDAAHSGPGGGGVEDKRAAIAAAAMAAARRMLSERYGQPEHSVAEKVGEGIGMGLGVLVTEALRVVPGWNDPVVDASGKPVASVAGAERTGNHDILRRHEEVVGPKITELVQKIPPGSLHDFLGGVGEGATKAPGETYRLEAQASDALKSG